MPNAAIYCRVSTGNQEREGTSLETQKDGCLKKAAALGYSVPPDYIFLEAWPGPDLDRPELNKVRNLIKSRSFDCLIFHALDRLSREPIGQAIIIQECDRRAIKVVSVTEDIDNSPEGKLINYVRGFAASVEREKIRERTMRGKKEKARQGTLSMGGPRLYGYDTVGEKGNRRRVINPVEAEVVRRIFNWFARDGYTLYRAYVELLGAGITGTKGHFWSSTTVYYLLTNTAYKGVTNAFRYIGVVPKHPKSELRKYAKSSNAFRDPSEWIPMPDATPAIVDAGTWDAAQAQLQRNRVRSPRNKRHDYLFSGGYLHCGVCGHALVGSVKKFKNGAEYRYYRCACNIHPHLYGKCPMPMVRADYIEGLFWDKLKAEIRERKLVTADIGQPDATGEADLILADSSMKRLLAEEQRLVQLFARGVVEESAILPELDRIKKQKAGVAKHLAELRDLERRGEETAARMERAAAYLAEIEQKLDGADFEAKRYALEMLDIKVTAMPDKTIRIKAFIP